MKFLAGVFGFLLFFVSGGEAAPLYRAGQASSASVSPWLHGEISVGYLFSNDSLQDYTGQISSERFKGWNARVLWRPWARLAIGGEYSRMGEVPFKQALVDSYTMSRLGAVVKWTISPNTNPRLYVMGGYGKSIHQFDLMSSPSYKKSQPYWMGGLGVEISVYKFIFAAAEGNIYWHKSASLHTFYQLSDRVETGLHMHVGVRF